ncbi:hypothetical protein NM688_g7 [Phlebia brevispora]|uniref:Uncharacterized protein n=1 Tax=Phlebia brevispora TaxID=194682 RepID=A0ACC1TFC9_9APHY|nr:hypothetical protein NM688_g7 [Phlebia brevispora]
MLYSFQQPTSSLMTSSPNAGAPDGSSSEVGNKRPRLDIGDTERAAIHEPPPTFRPFMTIHAVDGRQFDFAGILNMVCRCIGELEAELEKVKKEHTLERASLEAQLTKLQNAEAPPPGAVNNKADRGAPAKALRKSTPKAIQVSVAHSDMQANSPLDSPLHIGRGQRSLIEVDGAEERHLNGGRLQSRLPDPLPPDAPPRKDAIGAILWNPIFIGDQPDKADYNECFCRAVVNLVLTNAKDHPKSYDIPASALEKPDQEILPAVKQFFRTCCGNYKAQIAEPARAKQVKKTTKSCHMCRKLQKFNRRMKFVAEFEKLKDVSGVSCLLDKDWMSDEESENGDVEKEIWDAEAEKVKAHYRGSKKAFEVIVLEYRAINVSRVYYALDALAYKSGKRSIEPCFHGLKANTFQVRPSTPTVPHFMLAEAWLQKLGN